MEEKEPLHYIYYLRCPISKEVKYVGASMNPKQRFGIHLSDCYSNKKRAEWIAYLKTEGLKPILEIVHRLNTRKNVGEIERRHIKFHRGTIFNGKHTGTYATKYKDSLFFKKEHLNKFLEE